MLGVKQPAARSSQIRLLLKIVTLAGLVVLVNSGGHWVAGRIEFQFWPEHEQMALTILWFSILVYILLMALPFAPGVELGLALMMVLGPKGIVLVYLCTLLSLSLSFVVGRLIPLRVFAGFLGWLHLQKARDLLIQLEPLSAEQKMKFILKSAPLKIIPFLVRHRYLMIALILNLPGNALVGGGGGVGVIAGMSGLYPFFKFLLLIGLSILPLPLLILSGYMG